jgi:hypothetical protein
MGKRRTRALADRGAVAVEALLVAPILIMLAFGAIEWTMVLRDQMEVTSVARAGARTASQLAPLHNPYVAPVEPISASTAKAIRSAASGLPFDSIDYILVYRANDVGYPGKANARVLDCDASESTCDKLVWVPDETKAGGGSFVNDPGVVWDATSVNSCLGDTGAQSVGVYIKARRHMITGLFGSTQSLESRVVMKFEPQKPGRCSKL